MEFIVNNRTIKIDDEDSWILDFYKVFNIGTKGHVQCVSKEVPHRKATRYYVHRLVIRALPHEEIDHIDGNPLNNHKSNLRAVSRSQNIWNSNKISHKSCSSKYKGVSLRKKCKNKRWESYTMHNGKKISFGLYETEKEAAIAYNDKIIKLRGEYAKLNNICD